MPVKGREIKGKTQKGKKDKETKEKEIVWMLLKCIIYGNTTSKYKIHARKQQQLQKRPKTHIHTPNGQLIECNSHTAGNRQIRTIFKLLFSEHHFGNYENVDVDDDYNSTVESNSKISRKAPKKHCNELNTKNSPAINRIQRIGRKATHKRFKLPETKASVIAERS